MKIIIMVLASKGDPYDTFLSNWKSLNVPEGMKVIYYFFDPMIQRIELRGNELYIPGEESIIPGTHIKTIAAFKYALANEDFDYLVRPNLSSAINFFALQRWLVGKPIYRHGFGPWMFDSFLSGCGFALTRDVVKQFVQWDHPARPIQVDDLMLKEFMDKFSIPHTVWSLLGTECDIPNFRDPNVFHHRFMTNREDRSQDKVHHKLAIEYFNSLSSSPRS
jgi:hypothetical protein